MNKKNLFKNIVEWIGCIIIAIVLALLFRYFIGTPTIVKMSSMYPTLEQNDRLWLNRIPRTTKSLPNRGEIITFERPIQTTYTDLTIDKNYPKAKYNKKVGIQWFIYNFLEIGKYSYIKRVIALPGEHVKIEEGKIYINGDMLKEHYLQENVITNIKETGYNDFVVPENYIFAMGDNRENSIDCRDFGCIPLEKIESIVSIRIWPLNKLGEIK